MTKRLICRTYALRETKKRKIFSARVYIWQELRKEFGTEIPEIVPADFPLTLQLLPCDLVNACPLDPMRCAWALCFKRMFKGSRFIMFWKKTVYAHCCGPDGKWRIYKFSLTEAMRRVLFAVDRGQQVIAVGQFFTMSPMPPSSKPKVRRARDRIYNIERRRLNTKRFSLRQRETEAVRALKLSNTVKNRARLRAASAALSNFNKKYPRRKSPSITFDLTTRNGAIGNYKFEERAI